ncbi:MAG: hypothetical protein Q9191_004443 [Dirinaria sp. TL-2023a]
MLRMKPTQIELNARDLNWHNARHETRQKQRAKGHRIPIQENILSQHTSTKILEDNIPAYQSPDRQLSRAAAIVAAPQMPLFSRKPDLHKFWSGVMVGAGVLPNMQHVVTRKPFIVSGPSCLSSGLHSAKASLQEDSSDRCAVDDDSYRNRTSMHGQSRARRNTTYQHDLDSLSRLSDAEEDHENDVDSGTSQALTQVDSSYGYRPSSSSSRNRSQTDRGRAHAPSLRRRDSHLRNLDGSSDPLPRQDDPQGRTAASAGQFSMAEGPLAYQQTPPLHNGLSSGTLGDLGFQGNSSFHTSPFSPDRPMDCSTRAFSSSPPQLPLPIDNVRRFSNAHRRSPLYISQVPSSSSPEKRPRPPSDTNEIDFNQQMELMRLQSRRRKRYKRRSQSYPFVLSETEPMSNGPDYSARPTNNTPISIRHKPTAIIPEISYTYSSLPSIRGHLDTSNPSSASEMSSVAVSPARRDPSPSTNPPTPCHHPPWDPPLPVPPHAFSAVRRAVSIAPALPSATLSPSPTPQNTSLLIRQGQLELSGTEPTQQTPSYEVYNDRLPASSQPQTPRGLPTNGVPRSGLPSIYRGAFTAPAGIARRTGQRTSQNAADHSPTRQGSRRMGLRLDDQENERHGYERERRWRRQASSRGLSSNSVDWSSEDAEARDIDQI